MYCILREHEWRPECWPKRRVEVVRHLEGEMGAPLALARIHSTSFTVRDAAEESEP
jgi:hypothetical protein